MNGGSRQARAHIAATAGPEVAGAAATGILSCEKKNRSHTQTHDKNNTTNDQTKDRPPHLTTIEGGAATVRTTSHARVGGRAEVSVNMAHASLYIYVCDNRSRVCG